MLAGEPDILLDRCERLEDAGSLVDRHRAQVLVAVVDAPGGEWPASIALRLQTALPETLPIVIVCEASSDAAAIESQAAPLTSVVLRERMTPEALAAVVRGAAARAP